MTFAGLLNQNSKRTGLTANILSVTDLTPDDVDKFNDISLFYSWLYEYFSEQDGDEVWPIQNSQQEYVQSLSKKYDSKYFAVTGVQKDIFPRSNDERIIAVRLAMLIVPLPYTIYILTSNEKWTSFGFYLFDMDKGEITYSSFRSVTSSDFKYVLNSNIYDVFNQIHSKPKKR